MYSAVFSNPLLVKLVANHKSLDFYLTESSSKDRFLNFLP